MTTVGIRTLKNELSRYVRLVAAGERVIVTRRGTPVIDLVPHGSDAEDELERLARAGWARLGDPDVRTRYTRPPPEDQIPHDELMAGLDWIRGER